MIADVGGEIGSPPEPVEVVMETYMREFVHVDRRRGEHVSRARAGVSAACAVMLMAACSHTMPEYTAKPAAPTVAPTAETAAATAPARDSAPTVTLPQSGTPAAKSRAKMATAVPVPESVIPMTLTLDLRPVRDALKASLPERLDATDHPLSRDYQWTFVREGEPEVSIQDGHATVRATYRGDIANTGARGCRLDPVFPVIQGTADIGTRQMGDDLILTMLEPRMAVDVLPESDTRCNMFNIPVKDQLPELINQAVLTKQFGEALGEGRYRISLRGIWEALNGPTVVPVQALNGNVCLYAAPSELAVDPIRGDVERSTMRVTTRAKALAVIEPSCHTEPLPPLRVTSPAASMDERPFRVLARVPISYAAVSERLQDALFHKEIALGNILRQSMVIERVQASDVDRHTLLTVTTSGDVSGRIYYWVTPAIESKNARLSFGNPELAAESKRQLEEAKEGIWPEVDRQLRSMIASASPIDLSEPLARLRSAVAQPHRADNVQLQTSVVREHPERVISTPDALIADVLLEGTATGEGLVSVDGGRVPTTAASQPL